MEKTIYLDIFHFLKSPNSQVYILKISIKILIFNTQFRLFEDIFCHLKRKKMEEPTQDTKKCFFFHKSNLFF